MQKTARSRTPVTSANVDAIAEEIIAIADAVWKHAELAFKETKSVNLVKEAIAKHGFRIVHDGVGDLATAFVAEYGKGKPVVGILAEYDALPGLGNAAQPSQVPGPTGTATGHACGHNLIGAGAWGAAVAVRDWMAKTKTPGHGAPVRLPGGGRRQRQDVDGAGGRLRRPRRRTALASDRAQRGCQRAHDREYPLDDRVRGYGPPMPACRRGSAAARCMRWSCSRTA